jgi:hypothetical protein
VRGDLPLEQLDFYLSYVPGRERTDRNVMTGVKWAEIGPFSFLFVSRGCSFFN